MEEELETKGVADARPCPKCGFPMERGFLASNGTKLYFEFELPNTLTSLGLTGDPIGPHSLLRFVALEAIRCPECRHLEIDY